jgi:hypothetical protein
MVSTVYASGTEGVYDSFLCVSAFKNKMYGTEQEEN